MLKIKMIPAAVFAFLFAILFTSNPCLAEKPQAEPPQNGHFIERGDKGKKSGEGEYHKGKKDGLWTYWYENGQKKMEGSYKQTFETTPGDFTSLMDGEWKYWTPDGKSLDLKPLFPSKNHLVDVNIDEAQGALFLTLAIDDEELTRFEYIQRSSDIKPILYFKHNRWINRKLGNRGKLIVVNNYDCSNCETTFVHDLKTGKDWDIDEAAYKKCDPLTADDCQVWPVGEDFSPDDEKVLIRATIARGKCPHFKDWACVVDVKTGRILHEYPSKDAPKEWWIY